MKRNFFLILISLFLLNNSFVFAINDNVTLLEIKQLIENKLNGKIVSESISDLKQGAYGYTYKFDIKINVNGEIINRTLVIKIPVRTTESQNFKEIEDLIGYDKRVLERVNNKLSGFPEYIGSIIKNGFTKVIVIDYIDGLPLPQFIKENPGQLENYRVNLIKLLEYFEKNGLRVWDSNLDNFYVTKSGKLVLVDAGSARPEVDFSSNKPFLLTVLREKPDSFKNLLEKKPIIFDLDLFKPTLWNRIKNTFKSKTKIKPILSKKPPVTPKISRISSGIGGFCAMAILDVADERYLTRLGLERNLKEIKDTEKYINETAIPYLQNKIKESEDYEERKSAQEKLDMINNCRPDIIRVEKGIEELLELLRENDPSLYGGLYKTTKAIEELRLRSR